MAVPPYTACPSAAHGCCWSECAVLVFTQQRHRDYAIACTCSWTVEEQGHYVFPASPLYLAGDGLGAGCTLPSGDAWERRGLYHCLCVIVSVPEILRAPLSNQHPSTTLKTKERSAIACHSWCHSYVGLPHAGEGRARASVCLGPNLNERGSKTKIAAHCLHQRCTATGQGQPGVNLPTAGTVSHGQPTHRAVGHSAAPHATHARARMVHTNPMCSPTRHCPQHPTNRTTWLCATLDLAGRRS